MFGFPPEFVAFSIVAGLITVGVCIRAWRVREQRIAVITIVGLEDDNH